MNPYISFKELQPKRVLRMRAAEIRKKKPYGESLKIVQEEKEGRYYEKVILETTIFRKEIFSLKEGKIILILEEESEELIGYEVENPQGQYTFYAISGKSITGYQEIYSYAQGVMLFKMHDGRNVIWQGSPKEEYSQSIVVNPNEECHMYLVKHDDPENEKMYYNVPYFYLKDSCGEEIIWRIRNQMFPVISTGKIPKQNYFKTVEANAKPIKDNLKFYFDRLHEVNYGKKSI